MRYRLQSLINSKYRLPILIINDISATFLSLICSSTLVISLSNIPDFLSIYIGPFFLFGLIKVAFFYSQKLYCISWRYASLSDIGATCKTVALSSLLLSLIATTFSTLNAPLLIIDFFIFTFIFFSSRFTVRVLRRKSPPRRTQPKKHVLIVGAGDAAEMVAREMIKLSNHHHIVGFLDDNPVLHNKTIHQAPVLGDIQSISYHCKQHPIDQIIIAIPSASADQFRQILHSCKSVKVPFLTTPSIQELFDDSVSLDHLRDVSIVDLLGRSPINIDSSQIQSNVHGKTILITGAGGSIGSEMSRQIMSFSPKKVLLLDHSEFHLYSILLELNQHTNAKGIDIVPICMDIKLHHALSTIFNVHRPEIVFHSAAYKHVPLMEVNTDQAILNNVGGTKHIVDCCHRFNVGQCIVISTDKAVEPSNAMGATKRLCELITLEKNKHSNTAFSCVRFGNVLGSYGSVIPLFKDQIKRGGPITITDPNMTRYFMTITEAVSLVFQSTAFSTSGGELFVLDMGTPIKITDLASDLIRLSGLTEDDIPIEYTGLRPGEKLSEQLFYDFEQPWPTPHDKIKSCSPEINQDLNSHIETLLDIAQKSTHSTLIDALLATVTTLNQGMAIAKKVTP